MSDYELLDCGGGLKLERFGDVRVIRPAPGVPGPIRSAESWRNAQLEFRRDRRPGTWIRHSEIPDPWIVESSGTLFSLDATPTGQVGLFPEQAGLRVRVRDWLAARPPESRRMLDLFGHTGGHTLAAAGAGAHVTYVDGARATVAWMRRNLEINGLADAPVRSIAEDVARFVERETRRKSVYDAIVLDPPSFGRGPDGKRFQIERDLDGLLANVRRLLVDGPALAVLTAHTESWTDRRLAGRLDWAMRGRSGETESGELVLEATSGTQLPSGLWAVREMP